MYHPTQKELEEEHLTVLLEGSGVDSVRSEI